MHLKKEQRFQIILKASLGSSRMAVNAFNRKHRTTITHDTVKKLIGKLKKTGIATDQARCGRRRTASDEGKTAKILAVPTQSSTISVRQLSAVHGISKSSICHILKINKWYPYKLQMAQQMSEDEPDRWMEFCEWVLRKLREAPNISTKILISAEANFYVNG